MTRYFLERILFGVISDQIELLVSYIDGLRTVRQSGWGGQLWSDFWRIFLSRREEKNGYSFSVKATAVDNNLFGDYDTDNIGDPVTIIDYEKANLSIHKARGTESGIQADIKRMCNTTHVELIHYGQNQCGWIGDVTSLELTPGLLYDPDNSLCYMDLDNMVVIGMSNNGNRTNIDVEKIIRHDIVPLKYNLKLNIERFGFGGGGFGEVPFGGG
jgi:hypothetical protein